MQDGTFVVIGYQPSPTTKTVLGAVHVADEAGDALRYVRAVGSGFSHKAAARTITDLWRVIGESLDAFSPEECANYFKAARYEPDQMENALASSIRPGGSHPIIDVKPG